MAGRSIVLAVISIIIPALMVLSGLNGTGMASGRRFLFTGDGHLCISSEKNDFSFAGRYRSAPTTYDEAAYRAICRVFDAPYDPKHGTLSLRLIEFLDYLQDRLAPDAQVTITSGYRSPTYNTRLRENGGLAAKASLHQYGMAADLKMAGVSAQRIWRYVKELGFGGAGYYHGETVHLDVGPARSWDETTSGVGTGISDDNKLVGLVTDYDLYFPGETIEMRFIRMTAFPIKVSTVFSLTAHPSHADGTGTAAVFTPVLGIPPEGDCPQFQNIAQMAGIRWQLPTDFAAGRYVITARFCQKAWDAMPSEVATSIFEVSSPMREP